MDISKPRRQEGLLTRDLGEEFLLYDEAGKSLHVLNRSAYIIWNLCDGEHSIDDMVSRLFTDLDCRQPREQVAADVAETLVTLSERHLLQTP